MLTGGKLRLFDAKLIIIQVAQISGEFGWTAE